MKKILFLVLSIAIATQNLSAYTSDLIKPKGDTPIIDIGTKTPINNIDVQIQKDLIEVAAKTKLIPNSFFMTERVYSPKIECISDELNHDTCPTNMQTCPYTPNYNKGFSEYTKKEIIRNRIQSPVTRFEAADPNQVGGDYQLTANLGSYSGASFAINTTYTVSAIPAVATLLSQGFKTADGKLAMRVFNFGSGAGGIFIHPAPTSITMDLAEGSYLSSYSSGSLNGIQSFNAQYGVATLIWDTPPASLSYSCDDYCIMSTPNNTQTGFWGYKCPEGFVELDSTNTAAGLCKKEYSYYQYKCNDDSNVYSKNYEGPLIDTGGDCLGVCGPYGCYCNGDTPPENNCMRPNWTCPIDSNSVCTKTTDDGTKLNNYNDKFIYAPGFSVKHTGVNDKDKICPTGMTFLPKQPGGDGNVCIKPSSFTCQISGFTYDPVEDLCKKDPVCEGVMDGVNCLVKKEKQCEGSYVLNKVSGECEETPYCDKGTYNIITGKCEDKSFDCKPGFTRSLVTGRCEKPLDISNFIENPARYENGSSVLGTGKLTGSLDSTTCPSGSVLDPATGRCNANNACDAGGGAWNPNTNQCERVKEFTYAANSRLIDNSYAATLLCSDGIIVNGNCEKTTILARTENKTCPDGGVIKGDKCYKNSPNFMAWNSMIGYCESIGEKQANCMEYCDSNSGTCSNVLGTTGSCNISDPAQATYADTMCIMGSTMSNTSGGWCNWNWATCGKLATINYTCTEGTMSGTDCIKTDIINSYSCPSGGTLVGSTCQKIDTEYYCNNDTDFLDGTTCSSDDIEIYATSCPASTPTYAGNGICYSNAGCKTGFIQNGLTCELNYSFYNYTCPASVAPEQLIVLNQGGDCLGSCGIDGCYCNSGTPPTNNCKYVTKYCPVGYTEGNGICYKDDPIYQEDLNLKVYYTEGSCSGSATFGNGMCNITPTCELSGIFDPLKNKCLLATTKTLCPLGSTPTTSLIPGYESSCIEIDMCPVGSSSIEIAGVKKCISAKKDDCKQGQTYNKTEGRCEFPANCPTGYKTLDDKCTIDYTWYSYGCDAGWTGPDKPGEDCDGIVGLFGGSCNSELPIANNCRKPFTFAGDLIESFEKRPLIKHKVTGEMSTAEFGTNKGYQCGDDCLFSTTKVSGKDNKLCFSKNNGTESCFTVDGCLFQGSIENNNSIEELQVGFTDVGANPNTYQYFLAEGKKFDSEGNYDASCTNGEYSPSYDSCVDSISPETGKSITELWWNCNVCSGQFLGGGANFWGRFDSAARRAGATTTSYESAYVSPGKWNICGTIVTSKPGRHGGSYNTTNCMYASDKSGSAPTNFYHNSGQLIYSYDTGGRKPMYYITTQKNSCDNPIFVQGGKDFPSHYYCGDSGTPYCPDNTFTLTPVNGQTSCLKQETPICENGGVLANGICKRDIIPGTKSGKVESTCKLNGHVGWLKAGNKSIVSAVVGDTLTYKPFNGIETINIITGGADANKTSYDPSHRIEFWDPYINGYLGFIEFIKTVATKDRNDGFSAKEKLAFNLGEYGFTSIGDYGGSTYYVSPEIIGVDMNDAECTAAANEFNITRLTTVDPIEETFLKRLAGGREVSKEVDPICTVGTFLSSKGKCSNAAGVYYCPYGEIVGKKCKVWNHCTLKSQNKIETLNKDDFAYKTTTSNGTAVYKCSPLACNTSDHTCQTASCVDGYTGTSHNTYEDITPGLCQGQECDANKPFYPYCGKDGACPTGDIYKNEGSKCYEYFCDSGTFDVKTKKCRVLSCPPNTREAPSGTYCIRN